MRISSRNPKFQLQLRSFSQALLYTIAFRFGFIGFSFLEVYFHSLGITDCKQSRTTAGNKLSAIANSLESK